MPSSSVALAQVITQHALALYRAKLDAGLSSSIVHHLGMVSLRAALPRIRLHDLWHTAATLLLGRGVNPKIVSEMLGHASIGITLDTCSHVLPTMQQSAAAEMDAALSVGGSST